ncbi:MAG: hypothetical protein IKB38_04500 [Clostridia bacterium]|nr:hypothetical protein [Clostridia bacterium]
MKKYERISIEISESGDVVSTSSEVETGKIPFAYGADDASYSPMSYGVNESSYNT